ncbi:hypothetical protein PSTT_13240, partial [Puccinia striiformis]
MRLELCANLEVQTVGGALTFQSRVATQPCVVSVGKKTATTGCNEPGPTRDRRLKCFPTRFAPSLNLTTLCPKRNCHNPNVALDIDGKLLAGSYQKLCAKEFFSISMLPVTLIPTGGRIVELDKPIELLIPKYIGTNTITNKHSLSPFKEKMKENDQVLCCALAMGPCHTEGLKKIYFWLLTLGEKGQKPVTDLIVLFRGLTRWINFSHMHLAMCHKIQADEQRIRHANVFSCLEAKLSKHTDCPPILGRFAETTEDYDLVNSQAPQTVATKTPAPKKTTQKTPAKEAKKVTPAKKKNVAGRTPKKGMVAKDESESGDKEEEEEEEEEDSSEEENTNDTKKKKKKPNHPWTDDEQVALLAFIHDQIALGKGTDNGNLKSEAELFDTSMANGEGAVLPGEAPPKDGGDKCSPDLTNSSDLSKISVKRRRGLTKAIDLDLSDDDEITFKQSAREPPKKRIRESKFDVLKSGVEAIVENTKPDQKPAIKPDVEAPAPVRVLSTRQQAIQLMASMFLGKVTTETYIKFIKVVESEVNAEVFLSLASSTNPTVCEGWLNSALEAIA